jgi:hypothetical protein
LLCCTPPYGTAAPPSVLGGLPGALGGQAKAIDNLVGRERRAKAATFREAIAADRRRIRLNPLNRVFPVLRLLSPCYLPVTSLLSANNLPVIFTLCARRRAPPYFDNHLKRQFIFAAD